MKKALWYMVGAIFILSTLTFAAEKNTSTLEPNRLRKRKPTRMHGQEKLSKFPMRLSRLNAR